MRTVIGVVLATLFLNAESPVAAQWHLSNKIDPLTDERVATASVTSVAGSSQRSVVVRCKGKELEAYVHFDEFLDRGSVGVQWRVDKGRLHSDRWIPSTDGLAVFPHDSEDFARALMRGSQLLIEAKDFRWQPYRITFSLAGSSAAIGKVLSSCGLELKAAHPGVSHHVALEVERWGPSHINMSKRILAAAGKYSGPIDNVAEEAFYLAVEAFFEARVADCREELMVWTFCKTMRGAWSAGDKDYRVRVAAVLYELAPEPLKSEAGKLPGYA